jgi:3',5'-cyclic AMP phosphodiesterase CpdA
VKEKLNSTDRLILVRAKIERAKKHLRDLATEVLALENTAIVVMDLDTGVPPHPITFLHKPIADTDIQNVPTLPIDVVSIAGDLVHNLRAALDHLAQQLALVGCPALTDKELRQIEFPIAETQAKYKTDKARKIKGMRPEAIEAIDRLKPYKGGNDALWRIHELDNIDKHRALFTMAHDFLFIADWFPGTYLLKTDNPNFSGVESEVEQDLQAEIEEAVNQPKVSQSNALLPSLHQLVDFVEDLILSFEPFLR